MTLIPGRWNLQCIRGVDFRDTLTLLQGDSESDPEDLTGYSASLTVKDTDGSTLLSMSSGDGHIALGTTDGVIQLVLDASETAALEFDGGHYALTVVEPGPGDTIALLTGRFEVSDL